MNLDHAALDRHITGNYGEDSVPADDETYGYVVLEWSPPDNCYLLDEEQGASVYGAVEAAEQLENRRAAVEMPPTNDQRRSTRYQLGRVVLEEDDYYHPRYNRDGEDG